MATKIFLKQPLSSWNSAYSYAATVASVLAFTTSVTNKINGTTQDTKTAGGTVLSWVSPPVAAAVTISGTITYNAWVKTSSTTGAPKTVGRAFKLSGGVETQFSTKTSALVQSTAIQNDNFTDTAPTSTPLAVGDRIVMKFLVASTSATGTETLDYGGLTGAADGDSWVQLNENVTFQSEGEFIQNKDQSPGGTRSSDVLTAFAGTCAAGDLIWIWITWPSTTITITLGDNQGNTYTPIFGPVTVATTHSSGVWYAKNIAGGSAITVTVTYSSSIVGTTYINLSDYDGLDTTAPLDQTSNATTTSTAANGMDSGSKTTLSANEMIVGGGWSDGSLPTVGTNFLLRSDGTGQAASEDRSVTATGSYKTTETQAAGTNAIMGMATFLWGTQLTTYEDDYYNPFQTVPNEQTVTILQ